MIPPRIPGSTTVDRHAAQWQARRDRGPHTSRHAHEDATVFLQVRRLVWRANGQARHVWRIHTRTWCSKPTFPAARRPQAPSPRQWAPHVPHDSCATTASVFPPWQLYAFYLARAPFLGFTSPTPGLLEHSGACLRWLPGLLPAAPTGRTVLAVCEQ
jgi:hypothetical protein